MLLELRIENLLLIERAELRLGPGLNAITGETGAGKTVLAHALDLLLGGGARPQIVRPGAEEAWVEGVFELPGDVRDDPELSELAERLPEGDEVVLGRRIGASGRTSAFVGGRSASAADLRALGSRLLAFYGQHEHRRLALASAQREILDGFAGSEHLELRRRYRTAHGEATALRRDLERLRERAGGRERDLDLLRFELAEIESAAPDAEEEAQLAAERERLRHADRLRQAAGGALEALAADVHEDGAGAASLVARADAALAAGEGVDEALDELAGRVRALSVELDDIGGALRGYLEGIEIEPGRLETVEERLDAVDRLKRKHGGSVETVLAHAERCRGEIERLENAEELAGALEARVAGAEARRSALAADLTRGRERAAAELERRMASELAELAMEGATVEVELHPLARQAVGDDRAGGGDGYGAAGAETVELLVATNPGMPSSPLKDAASGGELSRIMLALSGLGPGEVAPTVVFDEIDAGVGGSTARAVGQRLRRIAEARQVLCITHLPQVASLASTHFRIEKQAKGGEARATVERVVDDELVAEIVRMLGGERGDEAASRHARELLKAA